MVNRIVTILGWDGYNRFYGWANSGRLAYFYLGRNDQCVRCSIAPGGIIRALDSIVAPCSPCSCQLVVFATPRHGHGLAVRRDDGAYLVAAVTKQWQPLVIFPEGIGYFIENTP